MASSPAEPDVRDQLSTIADDVRTLIEHLNGATRTSARRVRDHVADAAENGVAQAREVKDRLGERVQEKPLHALAVAAAAGAVFSWLMRRR